jgi:hypothetical protein
MKAYYVRSAMCEIKARSVFDCALRTWHFALLLLTVTASGCVDRRFVVESDPPGAIVYINDRLVGATPVDQSFVYYGKYRFVFVRDGYETLTVDECIRTPWWSYIPLDFVVENLLPYTVRDVRYIRHPLMPRQEISEKAILDRAEQLRAQGQSLGATLGSPTVAPVPLQELPPAAAPVVPVPAVTPAPMPR